VVNPVAKLTGAPEVGEGAIKTAGYAGIYGAALRLAREETASTVNLLPQIMLEQRRRSELMVHYMATGMMVVLLLVFSGIWAWVHGRNNQEQLERYSSYNNELEGMVSEID